tara:strand:+ start:1403 stop:1870 length:468 start_codon:yes stop_codon:yes gene_type:complete
MIYFKGDGLVKNINRDMTNKGILNILILTFVTVLTYVFMKNKGLFSGFSLYHHLVWSAFICSTFLYILYVMVIKHRNSSKVEKETYDLFTKGGFEPFKEIIILTDEDAILGVILIIVALIIPFPFNLKLDNERIFLIAMSKVGIIHLVASILKHF